MANGTLTFNGGQNGEQKESSLGKAKKDTQPTARDYLRILFRRKYFVLVPALICTVVAIVYSFAVPDTYKAQTIVLIEDKKLLKTAFKKLTFESVLNDKLNMIRTEMLSWNNLYNIIEELGMDVEQQATTPFKIEQLIRTLQEVTAINLSGHSSGTAVLHISYTGFIPASVKNYVNSLRDHYIEKQLKRQDRDTNEAINYIRQEAESYKKKIEKNENEAITFDTAHLYDFWGHAYLPAMKNISPKVADEAPVLMESDLSQLQKTLARYEIQIQATIQRKKAIEEQLSGEKAYKISESTTQLNPSVLALQAEIDARLTQLEFIKLKYTDDHPDVAKFKKLVEFDQKRLSQMDKEIKSSETTKTNPIHQQLLKEKKMVQINIETYRARREAVLSLMKEKELNIKKTRSLELERKMMMLDHGIAQSTYSELRSQLENTRITRKLENLQKGISFEVLEPARLPTAPLRTNKTKIWFMGLCVGLVCGIALILGLEVADHSFRGIQDVYRYSNLAILSVIPNFATLEERKHYRRKLQAAAAILIMFLTGAAIVILVFRTPILEVLQAL